MRVCITAYRPQHGRSSASQMRPVSATRKYCMSIEKLPPELRNMIYTLVLTFEPNESGTVLLTASPSPLQKPSVLALLQTFRTIKNEARSMFYFLNHIETRKEVQGKHSSKALGGCLRSFTRSLSLVRKHAIRQLTLTAGSWEAITSVLKQLPPFLNLRNLVLELDSGLGGGGEDVIVKEYDTETKFWTRHKYCLPPLLQEVRVRAVRDAAWISIHARIALEMKSVLNLYLQRRTPCRARSKG